MNIRFHLTGLLCLLSAATSFAQTISTIAGAYYGDGQTAFAIGIAPFSQVTDAAGNIYFTEPDRHVVRKLSSSGVYSTVAGMGISGYSGDGGPATAAQLKFPIQIARDSIGNIFITDKDDNRIRKISPNGIITTIAGNGNAGFSGDNGSAALAQLNGPHAIALDKAGNIYFSDINNHRIRKISAAGMITTIAGTGNSNISGNGGLATAAEVAYPYGIVINKTGEIFIAEVAGNVRKISTNGIITRYAGPEYSGYGFSGDGGPATSALFNIIYGIAIDTTGNVYIADVNNNRIRKVNTNGIVNTIAGNGVAGSNGDGGAATVAQLLVPTDIAVDAGGNLLIATNDKIRKVSPNGIIITVAGNGSRGYNGDNIPAGMTQLYQPGSITTDRQGNILFVDNENHRIRKITTSGIITTIAGTGVAGFSGDGGPATAAQLNRPVAICIDTAGNIFFTDNANNRIRKINTNGVITTVAGTGTYGFSGDGGPATAALISDVYGIAVDKSGNLFFSDRPKQRIRQINAGGIINTIAGNGTAGYSGDGGHAGAAFINYPGSIQVDTAGNVLFADGGNYRVRKITLSGGIITTVAGNGSGSYNNGNGGPAVNASLSIGAIAIDSSNNLLIGDYNGYIWKVNATGIISYIAGGGTTYGDGGNASAAQITAPAGMATDNQGNIYLTDRTNNRIRKITVPPCGTWTGNVGTSWENPQNWTCGQIPGSTSDVVIHSGTIRISSNVVLRSLRIDNGVNLTVATGYTLTVLQ